MNLYVYFRAPHIETIKVPSRLRDKTHPVLLAIRQTNAPLDEQSRQIQTLISGLYAQEGADEPQSERLLEESARKAKETSAREPFWKNWTDVFLFVPLWIVLIQVLLGLGGPQGIEGTNRLAVIEWGGGDLLAALAIYLTVKAMVGLLARYPKGWRRWMTLMGGYGLLLFVTWLCAQIPGKLSMPTIALVIVCACVFLLAWKAHIRLFGPEKSEPHIA